MSREIAVEDALRWADSIADGSCQECGSDGNAQVLAAEVRLSAEKIKDLEKALARIRLAWSAALNVIDLARRDSGL